MRIAAIALLNVLLWSLYQLLVGIPLWLLGWPICFVLARRSDWEVRDGVAAWHPRWAWLWGNVNDGVWGPQWWRERNAGWPVWKLAFVWSAWRNPMNNLHLVPYLHPVIDPKRIRFVATSDDPAHPSEWEPKPLGLQWSFTWQGIYAGVVVRYQWSQERHTQLRLGWKLLPKDRFGITPEDDRNGGCQFGVQLHVWRKS